MKSVYQPEYAHILSRLIASRRAAGLTQRELALMLSRPQSYVSKVERGERRLDVVEFIHLCRVLRIDPADFLLQDEE